METTLPAADVDRIAAMVSVLISPDFLVTVIFWPGMTGSFVRTPHDPSDNLV
jgi:hypothetical protein